ncbi:hypothetical protein HQQ81_05585 [Microbacteriaceae bacterium VKM Ac-2854]|nr:hypothetical protein [Microbacteriaceae bacterium VKM Ac-2854]
MTARNAAGYFHAEGIAQGDLVRIGTGSARWRVIGVSHRGATLQNVASGRYRDVIGLSTLSVIEHHVDNGTEAGR